LDPLSVIDPLECLRDPWGALRASLTKPDVECPDDRDPKLDIYLSELTVDIYEYIPVAFVARYCLFLL
jgi:hypothetical protein